MKKDFEIQSLDETTWQDFAKLVEANNGVWGGFWCMWYHGKEEADQPVEDKRRAKECRVKEGRAHAALVYDAGQCVGWCQFGTPDELPRIHNQGAYRNAEPQHADWRITASSRARDIAALVWRPQRFKAPSSRSECSAVERLKPFQRTPAGARRLRRSCSMARSPCSSGMALNVQDRSANTSGWLRELFERMSVMTRRRSLAVFRMW